MSWIKSFLFGDAQQPHSGSSVPSVSNDIKYYIYRSASKIQMLWEQIDASSRVSYSNELKISTGFLTVGGKMEEKDQTLQSKLAVVLKHLEQNGKIGKLGESAPFVRGTMPMTWTELKFYRGKSPLRLVLFSGYDGPDEPTENDKALQVGLVGSSAFVTGMQELEPSSLGYSQPAFWSKFIETLETPTADELKENLYDLDSQIEYQSRGRKNGPPKIKLDFVAKTFLSNDHLFLGSPLYVSESES